MKRNVLYFLLLLLPFLSAAQELNCRVEVNSDQIQGTNKESVYDFKGSYNRVY